MKEIILASASPRRAQLLEQIRVPFRVVKSNAPEIITQTEPGEIVKELSLQKAMAVAAQQDGGIVLGADTIVWLKGKLLGKPKDREDARRMLAGLQGCSHSVYTGVTIMKCARSKAMPSMEISACGAGQLPGETKCLPYGPRLVSPEIPENGREDGQVTAGDHVWIFRSFYRETAVRVHEMSEEEIEGYLDTGDPFDKAGSYGIQGPFAAFVDGIEGDYLNVVGLPVSAVYQELKNITDDYEKAEG